MVSGDKFALELHVAYRTIALPDFAACVFLAVTQFNRVPTAVDSAVMCTHRYFVGVRIRRTEYPS